MHARQGRAAGDDLRLAFGQFSQPRAHDRLVGEVAGQAHIGRMVPRLRFEQRSVERGQFRVVDMIGEQSEAFAAPGLDQPGDQQSIDGAVGLRRADERLQLAAIRAGLLAAERDSAAVEQFADLVEVIEFLLDDRGHLAAQGVILDIRAQQAHRRRRRLVFAMGMIDQDLRQRRVDLCQPTRARSALKIQHGMQYPASRMEVVRKL